MEASGIMDQVTYRKNNKLSDDEKIFGVDVQWMNECGSKAH